MRILIADDSATIRMILKGLLKQLGITDTVEASDGKAALQTLSLNNVDLLLLDIHMPNMDGLSCLEALKRNPTTASVPVIIISSDTTSTQVENAQKLGAHAYIQKPFRIEGLRRAIEAIFPGRQFVAHTHKN